RFSISGSVDDVSIESHVSKSQQPVATALKLIRLNEPGRHVHPIAVWIVEFAESAVRTTRNRVNPVRKSTLIREPAEKVQILLLHHEIDIINGDYLVCSGSKANGLYFDVAVEKLRRETGSFGSDFQRRALRQRTKAGKGNYY